MNTVFNDPNLILHCPILGIFGEGLGCLLPEFSVRVLSVAKSILEAPLKFLSVVLRFLEVNLKLRHPAVSDAMMFLKRYHAGLKSDNSLIQLCSLPVLLNLAEWIGRLLTFSVPCGAFT